MAQEQGEPTLQRMTSEANFIIKLDATKNIMYFLNALNASIMDSCKNIPVTQNFPFVLRQCDELESRVADLNLSVVDLLRANFYARNFPAIDRVEPMQDLHSRMLRQSDSQRRLITTFDESMRQLRDNLRAAALRNNDEGSDSSELRHPRADDVEHFAGYATDIRNKFNGVHEEIQRQIRLFPEEEEVRSRLEREEDEQLTCLGRSRKVLYENRCFILTAVIAVVAIFVLMLLQAIMAFLRDSLN